MVLVLTWIYLCPVVSLKTLELSGGEEKGIIWVSITWTPIRYKLWKNKHPPSKKWCAGTLWGLSCETSGSCYLGQRWSSFLLSGPRKTESMTPVHLLYLWHILFYEFLMFQSVYFEENSGDYKRVLSVLLGVWWIAGFWACLQQGRAEGALC